MATPPDQRSRTSLGALVCPIIVGRSYELSALTDELRAATSGAGRVVLISADAGMGKTRLVSELKEMAASQRGSNPPDPIVIEGHCFDLDRGLPYAPLLDAVRSYLAARAPSAPRDFGADAHALARLLPELDTVGMEPTAPLEPELEQGRLTRALARFLLRLAGEQPLVLILEDIHWADEASLEFLLYFARLIREVPVLVVATYRSDEVNAGLRRMLAGLDRERIATELRLRALTVPQVEEMLRAISGLDRPVRAGVLQPIYTLTEGNPYFIEEVLKSFSPSNRSDLGGLDWDHASSVILDIPRSVEDAVQRRVGGLGDRAKNVLRFAAVAGRRFDFDLLSRVTGIDEEDLLGVMKELIAAQLVFEESSERFAFRHALTREAVYRELLVRERRALHRTIAIVLAEHPEGRESTLSYHCHEAAMWEQTLVYARAAGRRAREVFATAATVEHMTRAIDAASQLGVAAPIDVLRTRGEAHELLGDFESALGDYEAAIEGARAVNDRQAEWQLLTDLGLLWAARDYAEAGRFCRRALHLARTLGDPATLAHSLNRLGNWYANTAAPGLAFPRHEQALRIFESLDDQGGIATTLDLLAMSSMLGSDLVRAAGYYDRAIAAFEALGDRYGLASSMACLTACGGEQQTSTTYAGCNLARGVRKGEHALQLARDIGWRAGEAFALWNLACVLAPRGDFGHALDMANEALAVAEEIEHTQWISSALCVLGGFYLDLLAPERARPLLERALLIARETKSSLWIGTAASALSAAHIAAGEVEAAWTLLEPEMHVRTRGEPMGVRHLRAAAAEVAVARSQPKAALQIIDALIASTPGRHVDRVVPRLARLRGEALAALGEQAEGEVALTAARDAASAEERDTELWRIELSLGRLYQTQHRRDDADAAFSAARALVAQLVATLPEGSLREDFESRADLLIPAARPASVLRAGKQAFGGLTTREREVVALMAGGKTNRQIAATLVISERTVESHISNALAKLGLASRTQLAAWALRAGLVAQ